jgi:lactate racemase
MQIDLAYGKSGLTINLPDKNVAKVFSMKEKPAIKEPYIALVKALLQPIGFDQSLFDMGRGKSSACVVIPDITRPMPNELILPPILKSLHAAGISKDRITILIATGTHRPNVGEELVELVGPEIAKEYNCVNHISDDLEAHKCVGQSPSGFDVWIDKRYLSADIKIATGLIEPHFMAGFSGGRKSVVPGVAAYETIKHLHGAQLMGHPDSREGNIDGNPFHSELLAIVKNIGIDLIVNVCMDENLNITGIFSGDLEEAHNAGVDFVCEFAKDYVDEPVDVVITTAAGYPLDKTWYQTIKGVTAAVPIVKKGGTIIIVSECSEGIGSKDFTELLNENANYDKFIDEIYNKDIFRKEQWQLQKYINAKKHANIVLVSGTFNKALADSIHISWAPSVDDVLQPLLKTNPQATIAAIPKGPYLLAEVLS